MQSQSYHAAIPSGHSSDAFLSIRSSCDRCHFQKLKCSISASNDSPNGTPKRSRARSETETASDERGVTTASGHHSSIPDVRGPSPVDETARITTPQGSTTAEAEVFCFGDSWDQVSAQYSLGLNRASGTSSAGEGLLGFTFQEDSTMNDAQLFDSRTGILRQGSSCEPAILGNYEVIPSASDASGENNSSSGLSTKFDPDLMISERGKNIEMLLSLASDLHSKLETLVQRPLQQGEVPETLDGYPIGSVLHLSQAFIKIAMACRRSRYSDSCSDPGSALAEHVRDGYAATTSESGPCTDPSVGLILLSCYITLNQVCTTVLGHFQAHLRSLPRTRNGAASTSTTLGPEGCLGELLATDAPHSRIHTAVCMLLESLGQVEDTLGLPVQIQVVGGGFQSWDKGSITERTTVPAALAKQDICAALRRWGPLSSVTSIQESFNVLEQRVSDIKELGTAGADGTLGGVWVEYDTTWRP